MIGGAVIGACVVGLLLNSLISDFLAERRYRAAVADADRSDPNWRAEVLVSSLKPIPDAKNSALRVSEIADEIGGPPANDQAIAWHLLVEADPTERLGADQAATLRSEFGPIEAALAKARALADFPNGRYPGARPAVTTVEAVPKTNLLRTVPFSRPQDDAVKVAYLLGRDAILRAEANDCEGAAISIRAIFNVGRSFGDEPSRLAQEVRWSITAMVPRYLERVLAQGEVPEHMLAAFQNLLEDEEAQPGLLTALRGDRAALDELFGKVVSGKLPRNAIPGVSKLPVLVRFFLDRNTIGETRVQFLERLNELVEAARLPEGERENRVEALLNGFTTERRGQGFVAGIRNSLRDEMLINTYSMASRSRIFVFWRRTAIVAMAAERYRQTRGRWPETFDELVPRWVQNLPADPFANGPLHMRRLADGLFLYSVGADQRDDGGKYDPKNRIGRGADAGFRLWDPGRRRQPARSAATKATDQGQ